MEHLRDHGAGAAHLVVVLNGQKTVDAQDRSTPSGPIAPSIWLGRG